MSAITANTSVSAYLPTPPSTPPPADILAAAKEDLGWALPPNGLHTVLGQFVVFLYEDHINSGCSRPPALDKAQTFYFDVEWIRSRRPRLSIPQFVQLVKYMLIIHFSVARIKAMKLATQDTFSKALIVRQHMEQNSELGPLFYLDDDEEDEDDTYYSSDYVDEDEYYEDHVEYKFPDE